VAPESPSSSEDDVPDSPVWTATGYSPSIRPMISFWISVVPP
jgi:hypothetical protein